MDTKDIKLLRYGIAEHIKRAEIQQKLRGKQTEAFRALVSDRFTDEQLSHSYFKLPTGFGKTVMFSTMARAYFDAIATTGAKKQKIIIIVPRLSLINQTKEKLDRFADLIATEYSGRAKDNKSDIIITTYKSLDKLFGVVDFGDVGLIFADEAHHMLGKKISEQLIRYNEYVPIIGFTATPEYESNRAVADMLNTEIFAMDIPESIKEGILSPVKNVLYRSSIVCDLSEVHASSSGEYDYDEITTKISPDTLATEIARIYAEGVDEDTGTEFKNLKAIINCPNAKIANLQAAKINEIMGREVAISLHKVGISNKKYDRLQQDFIDGKYTIACQVGTMTEGFDDVTVSMCINYPTRSRVKAEQAAGRAIRIDDNNPNKIAFVVDTIFRSKPNQATEDILHVISNSHQVLFKDIAGGMVFYPKDFESKEKQSKSPRTRSTSNIEFVDFDLITDSTTLIELNRKVEERIENETIAEKTEEWLSVHDLAADQTFPMGNENNIRAKLEELRTVMPDFIKILKNAVGKNALCLHRDACDMFLEKAGIQIYLQKTTGWQSALDLKRDHTFPMFNDDNINKKLKELQPDMPKYIQTMKSPQGKPSLCLHYAGRELFLKKLGIEDYPLKTGEWLSVSDLKRDPNFPMFNDSNILAKMKESQPDMPKYIQMMKPPRGQPCLCLHRDGWKLFLEKAGIEDFPPKTGEWLSVNELAKHDSFPMGNRNLISKRLKVYKRLMPEFIQERKPKKGAACLCLRRDKFEEFLALIQQGKNKTKRADVVENPSKTEDWQNATDLAEDKTFPMGKKSIIVANLQKFQSEMPDHIQKRKSAHGPACLCLHKNGREIFLEKSGIKKYPIKTTEWLSSNDLAKDKSFPMGNVSNILNKLNELQSDMPNFIQIRQSQNGAHKIALCLKREAIQLFLEKAGIKDSIAKTEEWLSVVDLRNYPNFLMRNDNTIKAKLQEFKDVMPQFIQMRKPKIGPTSICLHSDGIEEFLRRVQESKTKSIRKAAKVISSGNAVLDTKKNISPNDEQHQI